jgi:hypothetical protein
VVDLTVGDSLRGQAGQSLTVVDITRDPGVQRVYNLTVESDHVYFVGDLTTLTHNNCPAIGRRFGLEFLDDGVGVRFRGRTVDAMEDISHLGDDALREMFARGNAPVDELGRQINLHHVLQNPRGHLWEIPRELNRIGDRSLHPFGNARGAGLTAAQRAEFDIWRTKYWKARSGAELMRKGLTPW